METLSALFQSRPFTRWFLAGVLGRLSAAMGPVAMLVVGSQVYGSVSVGARLAAVVSVSAAVLAPIQGRRLDRRGVSRGLRAALWQSSAAGVAVVAAVQLQISAPWIDLVAVGLGVSLAVIPAGFRALLAGIVDESSLGRASHLDAVGFEVSLISAPLVVAAVAATSRPAGLFLASAALTTMAALVLPEAESTGGGQAPFPWRRPPAPRILTGALFIGIAGGLLEPAVFARVEAIGRSPSLASLLLAVIGVGSALGGVATSLRPPAVTAPVAARFLMLHGIAVLAVAFGAQPWTLAMWLFVAGMPIAPLMAVGATLLDRRVPSGERSTTFAIAGSAIALGTGLGQALAGLTISGGAVTATFVAAGAVAVVTAAVMGLSHGRSILVSGRDTSP